MVVLEKKNILLEKEASVLRPSLSLKFDVRDKTLS